MISTQCATCGWDFQVQNEWAGRVVTCPNCQSKVTVTGTASPDLPESADTSSKVNGLTIAGFICGLIGFLLAPCCVPLIAFPLGAAGLTCSLLGLRQAKHTGGPFGLAIAGTALSGVDLLIAIAWLTWQIMVVASSGPSSY